MVLGDELEVEFESGRNLEINIHAENRVFRASKFMLSSRSSVFRAMFSNNFEENRTNSIYIKIFEPHLVEKMLSHVHTDRINGLDVKSAIELYDLADYYDIKQLKIKCAEFLVSKLNLDNGLACMKLFRKYENDVELNYLGTLAWVLLSNDLNISTYYKYYLLGEQHKTLDFDISVIGFIQNNFWEVVKTYEWKKLPAEYRLEMFETQMENP
ncbi:Speckle-type POZ protein B-like, protein [Aphelenchoides bicaudatus]|nr:Speckle-type POZ protein B-like, protein [Aphelenchoides bicaudatus]